MSIAPIITFKAGLCEVDNSTRPYGITPLPDAGYVYLFAEDELIHFCWRKRTTPLDDPELDLVMIPTDGQFLPYEPKASEESSKTNGRIFVLKFASSSQRHLFWMQSKPQSSSGDLAWFSPRDRKIGELVNALLQGEEVDVAQELSAVNDDNRRDDGDEDETMEDVEGHRRPHDHHQGGSGGAGPDATGGDVRQEGEESREGGADGARAATSTTDDAATAVRNFLNSLRNNPSLGASQDREPPFPYLSHLLPSSITIPMLDSAPSEYIDTLLGLLPPAVVLLAHAGTTFDTKREPTPDEIAAAQAALTLGEKKNLLRTVLRSPQFQQALGSLTMALRDGGLPSIAEALGIPVENGGYLRGGTMPLGGEAAVQTFVEGIKKSVDM